VGGCSRNRSPPKPLLISSMASTDFITSLSAGNGRPLRRSEPESHLPLVLQCTFFRLRKSAEQQLSSSPRWSKAPALPADSRPSSPFYCPTVPPLHCSIFAGGKNRGSGRIFPAVFHKSTFWVEPVERRVDDRCVYDRAFVTVAIATLVSSRLLLGRSRCTRFEAVWCGYSRSR